MARRIPLTELSRCLGVSRVTLTNYRNEGVDVESAQAVFERLGQNRSLCDAWWLLSEHRDLAQEMIEEVREELACKAS